MSDHLHPNPFTSGICADMDIDYIDFDQVMVIPDTPDRISKQSKSICEIPSSGDSSMRNSARENRIIRDRRNRLFGGSVHAAGSYTHSRGDASSNAVLPSSSRNARDSNMMAEKTFKDRDGHHCYKLEMGGDRNSRSSFGGISSHNHKSVNPVLIEHDDIAKCSPNSKMHDIRARKIGKGYMLSSNIVPSHTDGVSSKSTRNDNKGKVKLAPEDRVRCNSQSLKESDNIRLIISDQNPTPSLSRNDKGKIKVIVGHDEPVLSKGNDKISLIASDHGADKGSPVRPRFGKRLVRNGCISPNNIAKAKRVETTFRIGSENAKCCAASGGSKPIIDISEVTSKNNDACRVKGKGLLIHDSSSNGRDSRRNDAGQSANERHKGKHREDCIILQDTRDNSNKDGTSRSTSSFPSTSFKGKFVVNEVRVSTPNSSFKRLKRSSCNTEKSPEVICLSSGGQLSTMKSSRDHGGFPTRELGSSSRADFSPEVRESIPQTDNDSEAREIQLKADEMLARELQEQLYNETPFFTGAESVSTLGGVQQREAAFSSHHANDVSVSSLGGAEQREDNMPPAFSTRRANDTYHRPSRVQPPQQSLRSRFFRRASQARQPRSNLSRIRSQRFQSHMERRLSGSHMDLEMRMHFLETLEAMYLDMSMMDQLFNSDREFGENDYEMLLALDENNHAHLGASVAQIANLPESTVNNDNCETCSICLENPVIGDTMRHLPCLHKFHKDCIDPWLRRRGSCPVCKSDV